MSGFITNQRLWGCTAFVVHVSDYVYVHLMRDSSLSEALIANATMENIMTQAGQTIKHYHGDKGIFADNGFINTINEKDQNLTFYSIGAHHQNGVIENKFFLNYRCKSAPPIQHHNVASND